MQNRGKQKSMSEKAFIHTSLMEFNQQIEDDSTIVEEREELMIPPNSEGTTTLRIAHFLKPLLNPKHQASITKPSFHSPYLKPKIKEVQKRVTFRARVNPQRSWKSWVKYLQKIHESAWKKVGIFNAIKASTYNTKRDKEIIFCLAEKWCPETNTFVFSWGESTITLEDIMILGGFSVMGNSVLITPCSNNKKFAEINDGLRKSVGIIRRNCNNVVTPKGWLEYYMGKGGELEHVGFLVLWLSRYVFCCCSCINVGKSNVFEIAISLALGYKIALAPAVLASIYRDLTLLKETIVANNTRGSVGVGVVGSETVLWAPLHLVQLWAWERFSALSPKPASLVYGEPRIAHWHNVRKIIVQDLRLEIESAGDSFVWRPYVFCLKNWDVPKFYYDEGMWVEIDSELDEELLSFVRCLRGCELVALDCVMLMYQMQYLPHRVGMQFGMDQDIPDYVPRFDDDYALAWSSYAKSMEGVKVYLPPRLFEGDVTEKYSRWRRPWLDIDDDDVLKNYSKRKRSSRKRKREGRGPGLRQLLEEGKEGRCTKALICSSCEGMISEKPLISVVDKFASTIGLYERDSFVADKENQKMFEYVPSNITLNEGEGVVVEKEKGIMVDDNASNIAMNEQEDDIVGEHWKDTHVQDVELSRMMPIVTVKLNQLSLDTKQLCSVLAEDRFQLGKDSIEAVEVKQANILQVDAEEQNDSVKYIQERSLLIESRISRLEKIVSMYKLIN